jgi:hypothetical protein
MTVAGVGGCSRISTGQVAAADDEVGADVLELGEAASSAIAFPWTSDAPCAPAHFNRGRVT